MDAMSLRNDVTLQAFGELLRFLAPCNEKVLGPVFVVILGMTTFLLFLHVLILWLLWNDFYTLFGYAVHAFKTSTTSLFRFLFSLFSSNW